MNGVRHFLLALQFFTRVPVTGSLAGWVGFSPAMLRASAAHFPGVGWLVGGVGAFVFWITSLHDRPSYEERTEAGRQPAAREPELT